MIKSLLDSDYYKQTMGQVFFLKYKNIMSSYKFVCRTKGVSLSFLKEELEKEIKNIAKLRYSEEEIEFLRSQGVFKEDYLEYLKTFSLKAEHVRVFEEEGQLAVRVEGPLVEASPWEIYLLASINELYFEKTSSNFDYEVGRRLLKEKLVVRNDPDFKIMEFGTRRRHSQRWQEEVLRFLKSRIPENLEGTSNMYLAMKMGVKPVGTMAHEYLQSFQALSPLEDFQKTALTLWSEVYGNRIQVALTDVISTDSFLKDFDEKLAKHYSGVRHDSGDPIWWGEKILNYYASLGIDAREKTLVFSDGLTMDRARKIHKHFKGRCKMVFGIGTSLTNDVGVSPLSIVIKMVSCDFKPVAKISDEPTKAICENEEFLTSLKKMYKVGV